MRDQRALHTRTHRHFCPATTSVPFHSSLLPRLPFPFPLQDRFCRERACVAAGAFLLCPCLPGWHYLLPSHRYYPYHHHFCLLPSFLPLPSTHACCRQRYYPSSITHCAWQKDMVAWWQAWHCCNSPTYLYLQFPRTDDSQFRTRHGWLIMAWQDKTLGWVCLFLLLLRAHLRTHTRLYQSNAII